jgi:hypothetical protein
VEKEHKKIVIKLEEQQQEMLLVVKLEGYSDYMK